MLLWKEGAYLRHVVSVVVVVNCPVLGVVDVCNCEKFLGGVGLQVN
jgi:hypothetical protein